MVPLVRATVISGETHRKLKAVCAAADATLVAIAATPIAKMHAAKRPILRRRACRAFPSELTSFLREPQQTTPLQRLWPNEVPPLVSRRWLLFATFPP